MYLQKTIVYWLRVGLVHWQRGQWAGGRERSERAQTPVFPSNIHIWHLQTRILSVSRGQNLASNNLSDSSQGQGPIKPPLHIRAL
ncbi:hypothetical protein B484DRAFT_132308 [Ochromonadaceae sp. CCMP2298]|nr:hypothetical protein B484DRAFT_132308 [Ochromonadaceae sp. CCMP2298]